VRDLQVDWSNLDAIHIHGGIWRSQLYYYLLRRRTPHAAWVVHLHGSEARSGKGLHHLGLADALLCSTPDLRRFVPRCEWLPNPVPLPSEVPQLARGGQITIGHFPSDRRMKGTDLILNVLEDQFGPPRTETHESMSVTRYSWATFDFLIAERISHDEVLARIEECDAVIDHLSELGPVSLVALEAMARSRAALSSYDAAAYPADCPVIRLVPETAGSTVREVLDDAERIRTAGTSGRRYVEAHHQPEKVAATSIRTYEAIQRWHGR